MEDSLTRKIARELFEDKLGAVTLSHLVGALGVDRAIVRRRMNDLLRAGLVEVAAKWPRGNHPKRSGPAAREVAYRTRAGAEDALSSRKKRKDTAADRIWRAIRVMSKTRGSFTREDLIVRTGATSANVREYTKRFRRAGVIGQRSRGRWVLLEDPGPRRPHISRKE